MESLIPDHTLLIQIFSFLLLIFLLNIIVFRPIRNILNKRKEHISSEEDMIRTRAQDAERYSAELEASISDTRKNGFKEKETLKSDGAKEEEKMLKETNSMVEEKINKARKEIIEKSRKAKES
ncbi:MAG: hypothetical protein JW944_16040, partial [Deltaproteobacteria bacterium]|nr:hypothetical protein [Deltaproteobacteria bacterium]